MSLTKSGYRKVVTEASDRENKEKLRSLADGKTKCERMSGETYGIKGLYKPGKNQRCGKMV